MRRWAVVTVLVVAAAAGLLWSTCAWVAHDLGVWGWSAESGTLRVPPRGVAWLPRWSFARSAGEQRLEARVAASSREGVPVGVVVRLSPPVGTWFLAPAPSPAEALGQLVAEPVRRHLQGVRAACLQPGAAAPLCPGAPAQELAAWIASTLRVPPGALEVALEPDTSPLGGVRLGEVAAGLKRPDRKLLVLGLDAADWQLVLPLVEAGKMPNLARLMQAGTWGEMQTLFPMLSPLLWTSMATGLGADHHGILDFVEKDPTSGAMVPITGRSRKVPAVWNVASALGLEVGVVGWWATWPAERVNGVMVSDRLYTTLDQGVSTEVLRSDPPDLVYPAELTPRLTALRERSVSETDWQAVRAFMDIPEARFAEAKAAGKGMDDPVDGFRRILAATRTYLGAGLELAVDQPDLFMVYLEGTDTIGHLLGPYQPPPVVEVDPTEAALYAAAIPRYYEAVDRWVGRYLERCPLDRWAILVLADHGFKWAPDRPERTKGAFGALAAMWHREDAALFIAAGSGIESLGRVTRKPSEYEVATTIAALLGLPAGTGWPRESLPGCPPPTLDPVDWVALIPVESYRQSGGGVVPVDNEALANLIALGYLEPGTTTPVSAAPAPTPLPASTTRAELNNLGLVKLNAKQFEEAERIFRQAIELDPNYASPHYNLRRIYMELRRFDDADRELWSAIDLGLRQPEDTLNRAAGDYESLELEERAEAILVRALERFPDHEPTYVHLMVTRMRLDRCADGVTVGQEAVRRFAASAPSHAFYGLCAACVEDWATARREIARSLELDPDQPTLRQTLADLPE